MEKAAWWGGGRGEAESGQCCPGLGGGRRGFAGFSALTGLHTGETSAWATCGSDASHCFSYRLPTLSSVPAIRLQAALCFCQCWTWHALQRGAPLLRGPATQHRVPTAQAGTGQGHVQPQELSSDKDKPHQRTPPGTGVNWAWLSISPTGKWMWPPVLGLRGFKDTALTRPCQMV